MRTAVYAAHKEDMMSFTGLGRMGRGEGRRGLRLLTGAGVGKMMDTCSVSAESTSSVIYDLGVDITSSWMWHEGLG